MHSHYMATTKDLTYSIESKRDISCVRLSWRIFNRLSDKEKADYYRFYDEMPEYGPMPADAEGRIRPLRQYIANMALWVYAKSTKKWSIHKCFRYARKNLDALYTQLENLSQGFSTYGVHPKRQKYLANQFLFHGFVPLREFRDIKEGDDVAYITSTLAINGDTYIYPHKLNMAQRPGKTPDKKFLWYQFESGLCISGHTRTWYPTELKTLKRNQDAQRNSNKAK